MGKSPLKNTSNLETSSGGLLLLQPIAYLFDIDKVPVLPLLLFKINLLADLMRGSVERISY